VKNYGVDERVIENAVKASQQFFNLPQEEKLKVHNLSAILSLDQMANSILKLDAHKTPNFKGYTACRKKNTDLGNRVSVFEAFDIGPESAP
jgi:isopenicillin N synthase-like dioxygenase